MPQSQTGQAVRWAPIASLANGANQVYTVTANVASGATGSLENVARATSSTSDPDDANNRSTFSSAVTVSADVTVTKTVGTATAATGAGKGIAGWIVIGVAGVGIAAAGIFWGVKKGDDGHEPATVAVQVDAPQPRETPRGDDATRRPAATKPVERDVSRRVDPEPAEKSKGDSPPEADTGAKRPRRTKPAAADGADPSGADAGPMADEIAYTSRMRAALAANPALTLKLAEEGDEKFRNGMFGRERLAYAILALAKLGRMNEARRRADAFLKRYPKGALAESVRAAVGAEAEGHGN